MMKSLISSVLRMTSLGPMVASSSCRFGLGCRHSFQRTQRSARRRRGGVARRLQAEVRDEELTLSIGRPTARGPHQSLAVGAEHGQSIEALLVGDPLLGAAREIHQVELVVGMAMLAGRVDDLAAIGMPVRPPVDEL